MSSDSFEDMFAEGRTALSQENSSKTYGKGMVQEYIYLVMGRYQLWAVVSLDWKSASIFFIVSLLGPIFMRYDCFGCA